MRTDFLPPESRLLLQAARPDPEPGALLREARAVRSWPAFMQLAERERACGTLWRRLAPHAAGGVDAEALATLRRLALVEGFRGQRQRMQLASALRALGAGGVRVMLLKGAAMATAAYPTFDARAMSDLDVLVRAGDGDRAVATLVAAGWRPDRATFAAEAFAGHHHLPPLVDGRHATVMLEPHTAVMPEGSPFPAFETAVWRDARTIAVDGAEALVPSAAHLALHACLHLGWSHAMGTGGWRTLRDLQVLVASGQLSWPSFASEASAAGAATPCYWTLAVGRTAGVVEVPDAVLTQLRPPLPAAVLAMLTRHFLLQLFAPGVGCPSVQVQRTLWALAMGARGSAAGTTRPWSRDERFVRRGRGGPGRTLRQRAAPWGGYLRRVLGRSTRAEPEQGGALPV